MEILNTPVPYKDSTKGDEDECERLLKEFSEAEVDEIASVSYAYWIVSKNARDQLPADARRISALKEIRRQYIGEGKDFAHTLTAIREALEYRRLYRFDVVRSCFYDSRGCEGKDIDLAQRYRRLILDDLDRQPMIIRSIDSHDQVNVYKPPRLSPGDTPDVGEAFMLAQIYTAERAMATNEFVSKGKNEKVTAIFNFRDYSSKNAPPTSTLRKALKVIQRCYPERLEILIIANSPFWLRAVYNILWPLLSTTTKERVRLPYNQDAAEGEFQKIAKGNDELKAMLENSDESSVNLTNYTQQPFYSQFEADDCDST